MPTIQVEAQLSPEELLKAIGQLSAPELDAFALRVLALRAERVAPRLSADATELLRIINQGVPGELQQRYDELIARRRAGTLTPEGHAELLSLTKQVEQVDAHRLELLAELARLRQVQLKTLIQQLGLRPRPHDDR